MNSSNQAAGRPDLFGPLKSFPINLQKIYPKSFHSKNRLTYGLVRLPEGRKLVVLGEKRDVSGDPFSGRSYHDTMTLKICDLSAENTACLMTLFGLPCWSPTGSHIAFTDGTTSSLWICEVQTRTVSRIFHEPGSLPLPGCWSRDGKSILVALMDTKTRVSTMWTISLDGKERRQITGHHDGFYRYLALSPDGSLLVYAAMEGKRLGLWIMPAPGGKSLPLVITAKDHNECPAWSPDGKRLAFASGRTGRGDIYVMEVDVEKVKAELKSLNQ